MAVGTPRGRRARCRGDHGAAAVEFALLFPLFLVIVFGIIDMGFAFNQKINLTQAAREASRYGATLSLKSSAPSGSGTVDTWLPKVVNVAMSAGGDDLTASRAGRYICVAYVDPTATPAVARKAELTGSAAAAVLSSGTCTSDGRDDARVQVVVRANTVLDFVFLGGRITIGSTSTTHFEAVPST
ncbi:MAG TPA: TadE family protein [Mycobacteriales bacterium]|jgi:hypothetical protein|nr:TadE family protein [Mycobacteriales bacterium]